MNRPSGETLAIRASVLRNLVAGACAGMLATYAIYLSIGALDPDWHASRSVIKLLELLPPVPRSGLLLAFALLLGAFAFGLLRLSASNTALHLSHTGGMVLGAYGWVKFAWRDVQSISVDSRLGGRIQLRFAKLPLLYRILMTNEVVVLLDSESVGHVMPFLQAHCPEVLKA
ncbi:hypothetical protein NGM99_16410 [Mesorhizobium sp. RP14(2022)]|uniref:PH domain-containing protein n=1 Tax=Mesorhizobium liriopis TaxID=2953882 RepID=A0ABT1CA51_9HYPH|nr:hypothetical protein [Mesorhizobium liriopis]MCO6051368.1 hypothetical protein [Mesorhizobium liriopis]